MILSKRERYIGIAAAITVGVLALDSFVFTPYLAKRIAIGTAQDDTVRRLADADTVFARQRRLRNIWEDMQQGGLKVNPSQAESQALQAILDWAKAANVELAALKPERSSQEGKFQVISFNVTAIGSMASVSRLLWSMETATIPVRLNDMQITPRREGADDLSVRLSVSALCMPPETDTKNDKPASPAVDTKGAHS